MDKLTRAAGQAIKGALKVMKGNRVLLVTDKQKMKIAEALAYWCKKAGAETTTYLMTETLRPITRVTSLLAGMMEKQNVMMYMLDARIEEKTFRAMRYRELYQWPLLVAIILGVIEALLTGRRPRPIEAQWR